MALSPSDMASTKADPAQEQEPADADDESVFTDSEEEEGEIQLGRRDVASDDEGDAEEGEIPGAQAAASAGAHHIRGPTEPAFLGQKTMQHAKETVNGTTCPSFTMLWSMTPSS